MIVIKKLNCILSFITREYIKATTATNSNMYKYTPLIEDDDETVVTTENSPAAALKADESNEETEEEQVQKDSIRSTALHRIWYLALAFVALAQSIFGVYVVLFYVRSIIRHKLQVWDEVHVGMYHPERPDSNLAFSLHLIGGSIMVLSGTTQYIPFIRRSFDFKFHRWNGRLALMGCVIASTGGMYYIFSVGTMGATIAGPIANLFMLCYGVIAFVCTIQTWRFVAIKSIKNIDLHKKWAYRLGGVLFGSNVVGRLILTTVFIILGGDHDGDSEPNPLVAKVAILLLINSYLPFIFVADCIWSREQQGQQQQQHQQKKPQWEEEQEKIHDENKLHIAAPSVLRISFAAVLLILFVFALVIHCLHVWFPLITMNFDDVSGVVMLDKQ